MPTHEPEVTIDSLAASLDDLVKAADATDLIKGQSTDSNRVEHSGTKALDGDQGGGRGSYPGNVEIDDMMIGKLAGLGFNAGQIAAMSGALVGKQIDEEDDEEDDDEDGEVEIEIGKMRAYKRKNGSLKGYPGLGKSAAGGEGEPMVKSMEQFRQDPDIDNAIDVSPYLEAMTARTAEQIDAINGSLAKGFGNQAVVNRALAGALHQMGTLVKSQAAVIDVLGQRLGLVERTPLPAKGVTTAQALHKSLPGEAGRGGSDLKKSEVLATLSYMNLEKGIRHINGQPTSQVIGMLEGGNIVSADVLKAVQDFHQAHPNESEIARSYH